jgi:hypothetical protein
MSAYALHTGTPCCPLGAVRLTVLCSCGSSLHLIVAHSVCLCLCLYLCLCLSLCVYVCVYVCVFLPWCVSVAVFPPPYPRVSSTDGAQLLRRAILPPRVSPNTPYPNNQRGSNERINAHECLHTTITGVLLHHPIDCEPKGGRERQPIPR